MLTNETVSKLQDMHLGAMARRFKEQLEDPAIKDLSFEDRFGILVDTEWMTRKNNHLTRLIKKAGYAIPDILRRHPPRGGTEAGQSTNPAARFLFIHTGST